MAQALHVKRTEDYPAPAKPEPAAQKTDTEMRVCFLCTEIQNMERRRFCFHGIIFTDGLSNGKESQLIDNFDTSA